jgi:hypothetical protein
VSQWKKEAPEWATAAEAPGTAGEGNDPDPGATGFFAEFVGDKRSFGSRLLESFLPLGPIDPTTPVPGPEAMTFAEMIPVGPLGLFPDDKRRVWRQRGFLEIATVGNTVQVVQPQEPRPGELGPWLNPLWSREHPDGTRHPINRSILPDPVVVIRVPWKSLFWEVESMAAAKKWTVKYCLDDKYHIARQLLEYLEGLNGRFPCVFDRSLCRVTAYAHSRGIEPVKDLIGQAFDVVAREIFPDSATPQSKS